MKVETVDPVAAELSVTVPVVSVAPNRPSRPFPRLVLIALGVGAIAFVAGLQFGGGPSRETAALAATSPQPTPSASASPARTYPAFAAASPLASPGSSRFVRTFDATTVIKALPGGAPCVGGPAGWQIARGPYPDETFVKAWMTFCPIAPAKRDAFLRQVLEAIAPVDRPYWDDEGVMAVTPYAEDGFVGRVAVATRATAEGIEIAVTVEEQTQGPAGTPVPLPAAGALAPGTYSLANPYVDDDPVRNCARGCADYKQIIFTLPAGWATSDGLVYKHLDQPGEVTFSAWTVDQVYADPCHWQGSALGPLDIAHHSHDATGAITLEDYTGGLANQAGRNASALTPVTLGGEAALRIELAVPVQLDLATCDRGEFRSWTEWDVVDGANSHSAPGQTDVVYMADVDRRALVIDASHMPAASEADLAELEAILASMIIDRGS